MGEGRGGQGGQHPAHTFPEAPDPFLSCDGLVGFHGALVSPTTVSPGLSLEADLYHICRLGHGDRQGTGGATSQETAPDARICGRMGGGCVSGQPGSHSGTPHSCPTAMALDHPCSMKPSQGYNTEQHKTEAVLSRTCSFKLLGSLGKSVSPI